MLETFPRLESAYVRIDDVPELAGKFSVFTAPTLILFVEGKEMVRKARFVVMQELEADIKKYYDLVM
jgi:thioredoxin-like negative regulator of GroEL